MDSPADLAYVRDGVVLVGERPVASGAAPALSPDGTWVAWSGTDTGNAELYLARPGERPMRVTFTPRDAERTPAWSPDGRRLVFERDGDLYVIGANGMDERRLVRRGTNPAWAPSGVIAFERDGAIWLVGADGLGVRRLRAGTDPAWSHDGRKLARVVGNSVHVGARLVVENARAPAFAPDGRIAFVRGKGVWVAGKTTAIARRGTYPAWRPRPAVRELLPDLDQLAPSGLSTVERRGRWKLGFRSAVTNVSVGALELVGSRATTSTPLMRGAQVVRVSTGGRRRYPEAGAFRFKRAEDHLHWHYLAFATYELRTLDGAELVRDRKSGFCLVDRHPAPGTRPVFLDFCRQHEPKALRIRTGSSPGNTDIYPAHFHGQNVDITDVPSGRYVLVHRTNSRLLFRESDYTNNAASLLIRLAWKKGRPSVRVLRRCAASERCYDA